MADHTDLGTEGERLAKDFLIKKNYQILVSNFRFGKEEIDLVAVFKDQLIIVEVKTRNSSYFGPPELAVTKSKQKHLVRAANHFVHKFDRDEEVRFDIIAIIMNKGIPEFNHIEDAFSASL